MNDLRTAAQQALEALEVATNCLDGYYIPRGKTTLPEIEDAIEALRAALADGDKLSPGEPVTRLFGTLPVYDTPPQRKPLTQEEAIALWADRSDGPRKGEIVGYCRAIERAHNIKE